MKKVTVTIKIEKTIMIEFDERIVNQEMIDNYERYFNDDVKETPMELYMQNCDIDDFIEDFPYMNIAKNIAHMHANSDISHTEGVGTVQNMAYSSKRNNPGGVYLTDIDDSQEFEFELDKCEFNNEPLNQAE